MSQHKQPLLSNKIINNNIVFLNRVEIKGYDEAYALLEIKQALEQLANENQTIETSPAIESK